MMHRLVKDRKDILKEVKAGKAHVDEYGNTSRPVKIPKGTPAWMTMR